MDKSELRRLVRAKLAGMTGEEKERCSEMLCKSIKSHLAVSGARVVALFSPLPDEPQIWPLVEELAKNLLVVLPRVEGDAMRFYCYDGAVESGSFGIMEPRGSEVVNPGEIDAIVVPGVVFTSDGKRVGRGRGYYDRYMSHDDFRALKLGVCYPVQIVDDIPCEAHDIVMDYVIYR